MENLNLGLELFAIGFPTVFGVLTLIVIAGFVLQRQVIPVLDRWFPEDVSVVAKPNRGAESAPPDVAAAIAVAVDTVSGGKYNVIDIKKDKR